MKDQPRCAWPGNNALMIAYHDTEWGLPLHNDQSLFEALALEAFQAGLNWQTVLNKRPAFRRAFADFDIKKVAGFSAGDIVRLKNDPGIIRNELKIQATVNNAKMILALQKDFGSFDRFIWQFVGYQTIDNRIKSLKDYPTTSKESEAMAKELKKRGFKFVGRTTGYAFMQAAGMVNDHQMNCFRYKGVK